MSSACRLASSARRPSLEPAHTVEVTVECHGDPAWFGQRDYACTPFDEWRDEQMPAWEAWTARWCPGGTVTMRVVDTFAACGPAELEDNPAPPM
jgi:hypothetical protein